MRRRIISVALILGVAAVLVWFERGRTAERIDGMTRMVDTLCAALRSDPRADLPLADPLIEDPVRAALLRAVARDDLGVAVQEGGRPPATHEALLTAAGQPVLRLGLVWQDDAAIITGFTAP